MIEIRIHGRGGQGGVTLAKLLAAAEHREGKSVQAFGVYAAERSGAPVQAYLRCDDEPIHNPNQIYAPDHLIVLDPTLISPAILAGLKPGGWILLNCEKAPEHYAAQERGKKFRIATVNATDIAVRNGLGSASVPIVNTALAGAVALAFVAGWSAAPLWSVLPIALGPLLAVPLAMFTASGAATRASSRSTVWASRRTRAVNGWGALTGTFPDWRSACM